MSFDYESSGPSRRRQESSFQKGFGCTFGIMAAFVAAAVIAVGVFFLFCGGLAMLGLAVKTSKPAAGVTAPGGSTSIAKPKLTLKYEGRDAEEWYERLIDQNVARVPAAAFALYELKEEGAPYLVKGLSARTSEARENSASMLDNNNISLAPYAKEAVPALNRMLKSNSLPERMTAGQVARRFGAAAKPLVPELKRLAKDKDVRFEFAESINKAIKEIEAAK